MGAVFGSFFALMFPIFFLLPFALAIWGMIARTRAARRMAARAGLNEQDAASTALWTTNGLDATYLAANLRGPAPSVPMGPPRAVPAKSVEDRLRELDRLKREGVITPGEYESQRKAIVGGI